MTANDHDMNRCMDEGCEDCHRITTEGRDCPACARQSESAPWPDHAPGCPDAPEAPSETDLRRAASAVGTFLRGGTRAIVSAKLAPFEVVKVNGGEDGTLYGYAVFGVRVDDGAAIDWMDAARDASFAREASIEWARDFVSDCQWIGIDADDVDDATDAAILANAARVYGGGIRGLVADACQYRSVNYMDVDDDANAATYTFTRDDETTTVHGFKSADWQPWEESCEGAHGGNPCPYCGASIEAGAIMFAYIVGSEPAATAVPPTTRAAILRDAK
jgi:hypothetical protein